MSKRRKGSLRLPSWDYRQDGKYHVTIITHRRAPLFLDSTLHRIARDALLHLPVLPAMQHVVLDEWVLMADHLHCVIVLKGHVGGVDSVVVQNALARPSFAADRPYKRMPGSLGTVIATYKSIVTRRANVLRGTPGARVWQRKFHDRIIRDERQLENVRRYIQRHIPPHTHDS